MLAGEVVNQSNIHLTTEQSIQEAFQFLQANQLLAVPVLNEQRDTVGIISSNSFFQSGTELHWEESIAGLMENNFQVIDEKTSLRNWDADKQEYLVIVGEAGLPKGIITQNDLQNFLLQQYKSKVKHLEAILEFSHVGIVAINKEGKINYFNQAAEQIVWRKKQEALGKHISKVIIPQGLLHVLKTGESQLWHKFSVEYSDKVHTYLTHRIPIRENGQVVGAVGVFQDISEIESISEELSVVKQLNKELETIIEASYDGILVADKDGVVLRMNKPIERLLEIDSNEKESGEKIAGNIINQVTKKSKTVNTMVNANGRQFMLTGNPILNSNKDIERIVVNVRDLTELNNLRLELEETKDYMERYHSELNELKNMSFKQKGVVIKSKPMKKILNLAYRVSQVDSTVLILGESGVGKEVIAKAIHNNSKQSKGPFIKVNCGAIPENLLESELFGYQPGAFTGANKEGKVGMFELANHGTLFLDEIGDLPIHLQVKILRAIQEREIYRVGGEKPVKINVRILAATNKDLSEMVENGEFREDLYFRLNVIPLNIPPLRERKEEIIPLIRKFQENIKNTFQIEKVFSPEAMEALINYSWPGNIRELENVVERLMVTSPTPKITLEDLPDNISEGQGSNKPVVIVRGILPLKKVVHEAEKQLLKKAIERYGSAYKAAQVLGVNQSTISRKLAKINEDIET